jgi:dihydrofolate synthase/folylpolyglutamate synthase
MDAGLTYPQALDFMYQQLPMFSHIGPAAYKADLNNIILLCELLDNPQNKFRTVHVAGTNGKGSVSHMLAAIFQQAGYVTGLYTSPHLKDFRERIRKNGAMIGKNQVTGFISKIQPVCDKIHPSFFEITVAMAFSYFAESHVDMAIIETGLGGRLDSTNIILPELSVITNISYDHQNILGDSLSSIAREKAGIIKPGIPVVISQYQETVADLFREKAGSVNAPIYFANQAYEVTSCSEGTGTITITVQNQKGKQERRYVLDLNSRYQSMNLLAALCSVDQLRDKGWQLSGEAVRSGLSQVKSLTGLMGRWDQIQTHPRVILDVGHNEAGIKEILRQLSQMKYGSLRIVLGTVSDKDTHRMLSALPKEGQYYFCRAAIPRALDDLELLSMASAHGLCGRAYGAPAQALAAAKDESKDEDLILVCGSCFVVGELL